MSELVTLPHLRNLTLAAFTVSNDSAAALAMLSRLELLDLSSCELSAAGLQSLAALAASCHLVL